jgi:hypothetical protein
VAPLAVPSFVLTLSPAAFARCSGLLLLLAGAATARAGVGYIVAGAQVLHAAGEAAVVAPWRGQAPIQGFGGYGRIHADGACLTAGAPGQPLRWEGCRGGDKAQVWKLAAGRLSNERGQCAQREAHGVGVRVLAAACNGVPEQRWSSWSSMPARRAAARMRDPQRRGRFLQNVEALPAGTVLSFATGEPVPPAAVHAGADPAPKAISVGAGDVIPLEAR